jgi:hypothetical protein
VSPFYAAAACLVIAQVLGVYGLVTRKADLVFSICMVALVLAAGALAGYGAYRQVH